MGLSIFRYAVVSTSELQQVLKQKVEAVEALKGFGGECVLIDINGLGWFWLQQVEAVEANNENLRYG